MSIRVVVVDDDPMVCAHLRTILATADDLDVVDEAHDGAEAVESATRHRPDVMLMDLRMPGMDGLTAIDRITTMPDPPTIVVLTTFDADHHVLRALHAGAAGYLLKSTPPEDLIGLIRVAAAGHTVLSPQATHHLLTTAGDQHATRAHRRAKINDLTERERDVLTRLGEGLSNAQIGARLHLTEATVKGYVSRILVKLGCANRTQAGLIAHELDLPQRDQ